jgi:hypothetical protein
MKRFVIRQNIEHYRALRDVTAAPSERRSIGQLLREEDDEDHKRASPGSKTANQSRFSKARQFGEVRRHLLRLK